MPKDATFSGDLEGAFNRHIRSQAKDFSRVDVVFDRWEEQSLLKDNTRSVRRGTLAQIRRMITGRDVPLPKNMAQFLDLGENKTDLSRFLSEELLEDECRGILTVVGGAFERQTEIRSTRSIRG